jgi:hypothetical protein
MTLQLFENLSFWEDNELQFEIFKIKWYQKGFCYALKFPTLNLLSPKGILFITDWKSSQDKYLLWYPSSTFQFLKVLFCPLFACLSYILGCLGSVRSNCNSKKWIIWFIMISPAKCQPPNSSITASNCIPRFWSFGRFVWKSKKLPNFFIFKKLFTFLF